MLWIFLLGCVLRAPLRPKDLPLTLPLDGFFPAAGPIGGDDRLEGVLQSEDGPEKALRKASQQGFRPQFGSRWKWDRGVNVVFTLLSNSLLEGLEYYRYYFPPGEPNRANTKT
jgi:hypothetical protein